MFQKRFAWVLLATLLWPAAHASAAELQSYLGIGLGVFGLEHSEPGLKQKNNVFGGFLNGGVDFNDYLGIQLRVGTTDKGKGGFSVGTLGLPATFTRSQRADYFASYLVRLRYAVSPDMRLYALAGATTAKVSVSFAPAVATSNTVTKTGFSYGAGFNADINDRWIGGLEWVQYWTGVKPGANQKMNIWGAVASVTAHF